MYIFIIPFFILPTSFPCIHHFCTQVQYGCLHSAGATSCTPEVVPFWAKDHFRDNYIPASNNLILHNDLQSAHVIDDNCLTYYFKRISFQFFIFLNFIQIPLRHDTKSLLMKYFIENYIQMRMSRVIYSLYIKLIVSFGALLYNIYPFLCSHGYKSICIHVNLYLFYIKIFYLASFMVTMHNYPKLLVIHIVAFLDSLYISYFLCLLLYIVKHLSRHVHPPVNVHLPVNTLPHDTLYHFLHINCLLL